MKGIAFSSSHGNKYFYDDDSGLIFPGQWSEDDPPPHSGRIAASPLGRRQPPPTAVDAEALRHYHIDHAHGFRHLILQVTAQCNLRCKYCVYSEHYPFNSTYSSARMSPEVARAAIDLFMRNHAKVHRRNPSSRPIIAFYGGEPLMAFDLIANSVEYFRRAYGTGFPDVMLTLTTNGVLLSDEIGDFLAEYGFSIIVSLDGDKENHDRNRVTVAGRGSFDAVYANLKRFRERHPGYERLAISACYDYRTDFEALRKFFDGERLFVVNIAQVDPNGKSYYEQFTPEEAQRFADRFAEFNASFARAARENRIEKGSFLFSFCGITFAEFAFHPVLGEQRPAFLPYTSVCVPGEKIYVTPSGEIHMCERINDKFPIGTVATGLDYQRIAEIIQEYNENVCAHCAGCPVTRFCGRCFAVTATDRTFELQDGYCARMRETVEQSLVRFVDIVEHRPELLDDITVAYYRDLLGKVGYVVE